MQPLSGQSLRLSKGSFISVSKDAAEDKSTWDVSCKRFFFKYERSKDKGSKHNQQTKAKTQKTKRLLQYKTCHGITPSRVVN